MARCPFAEWRPLPENSTASRIRPTQIIDHSIVGSAEGAYNYFLRHSNLESTFILAKSGHLIQCMDTERAADANYKANRRPDGTGAVSIETEDNGRPDSDPWTSAQLATLARLHAWLADTHGIPRRVCRNPSDPGLGYHTLFPGVWTPVSKTCPGRVRIRQWRDILVPAFTNDEVVALNLGDRLLAYEDPLMSGSDVEEWQAILAQWRQMVGGSVQPVVADGVFGPNTRNETERFQRSAGLAVDGVVGPNTLAAARKWLDGSSEPEVPEHDYEVTVRWKNPPDEGAARVLGAAHSWHVAQYGDATKDLVRITVGYNGPTAHQSIIGANREETARFVAEKVCDRVWAEEIRQLGRSISGRS